MTREEAIKHLNTLYIALAVFPNQQVTLRNVDKMKESVSIAIEALEQELVLDKIKEEIKDNTYFINETTEKEGIDFETVEKIIDKYKIESEVEK